MSDKVQGCSTCKTAIKPAKCTEGWCQRCARGFGMPPTYTSLYCEAHRLEVNRDWHCSDWESDK